MKIKTLSLAVLVSLGLAACGGGSDSGNSGNSNLTTPEFQQWTSFYVNESSDEELDYLIQQSTFDQGKEYLKTETTFEFEESQTILTANGVYESGPEHSSYGKLKAKITSNENTWNQIPHSPIGSTDLNITTKFNTKDISGQNIAQLLSPNNYIVVKYNLFNKLPMSELGKKFYNQLSNINFPQGSKCVQIDEVSTSQDYIELYQSSLDTYYQNYLQSIWKDISSDSAYTKKTFKNAIAYLEKDDNEETGYAQYQNNIFAVDFYKSGVFFDRQKEMSELEEILSEASDLEKPVLAELINLQKNSCNSFNEVASKAIREQMKNVVQ